MREWVRGTLAPGFLGLAGCGWYFPSPSYPSKGSTGGHHQPLSHPQACQVRALTVKTLAPTACWSLIPSSLPPWVEKVVSLPHGSSPQPLPPCAWPGLQRQRSTHRHWLLWEVKWRTSSGDEDVLRSRESLDPVEAHPEGESRLPTLEPRWKRQWWRKSVIAAPRPL